MFSLDGEMDEIMGHAYLFLKEQLEISTMPPPSGIVHGTIIGAVIFSFFPYPTPPAPFSSFWKSCRQSIRCHEELIMRADFWNPCSYDDEIRFDM